MRWWRDPEEGCRAGLGQSVHALLDADPSIDQTIERVFLSTRDDQVAHQCLLILIDAAGNAGLAEWNRLESRPGLAADDLAIEMRRLLEEFGSFTLWG